MVEHIASQEWAKLHHITMIQLDEVNKFYIVKKNGKFLTKPLKHYVCTFQCLLLYYKRKSREIYGPLDEYNVLSIQKSDFQTYCQSDELTIDFAPNDVPVIPKTSRSSVVAGVGAPIDILTAQESRRGVKRDMTHYETLKDDKHFNSWNRGFVATAQLHHTHLVLDEGYCPLNDVDVAVFK
jgi:hypothetical protein